MKQSRNTISDWLDKYGDPKIDKQVEKELEEIITKHQREMNETRFYHVIMYLTFFSLGMITTTVAITQGFFQEFIYVLLAGALFLMFSLAYHYVRGVDYMEENHPDYKGEDLFGDDEWDNYSDLPSPKAYERKINNVEKKK